ncbi:DUF4935 domain-containing protein [Streptomyces sp. ISL-1]|uniref:PIN domain-containing protein n=1 Tax=Streptomyces sp. ISL-1 TaxID=2817657 RepID=UPI001BEC6EC6|nr:PIN domain-containing protein [Streptomyces sp. ISL-1]MBT2393940.1 DUF4935 domain-containing protein [Streptomyces sp. ISL-1]
MIILDTCVIRGMGLRSSEADVLRAIRETGTERIAVPWMALEELAAQKAVDYNNAHREAARALKKLKRASVTDAPKLGDPEPEKVRESWRARYGQLLEVLPTSERALREGVYREANVLPPAAVKGEGDKAVKVGARDVAIWLTAVEYAQEHPDETVYFVSSNHKDFGKGGAYPPPMDKDVEELGDRFVHLTNLDGVLSQFAPDAIVDEEVLWDLLRDYAVHARDEALTRWGLLRFNAPSAPFPAAVKPRFSTMPTMEAIGWAIPREVVAEPREVTAARAYRLGDHEWCTVNVRWQLTGNALFNSVIEYAASFWDTRLLVPVVKGGPLPRILDSGTPYAPDADAVVWPAHQELTMALGSGKTSSVWAVFSQIINGVGQPSFGSWADQSAALLGDEQDEEGTLEGWEEAYDPDADSDTFDE